MSTVLIVLYIKFNLMLAAGFLLWVAIKHLARVLRFEVDQRQQLALARLFMLGLLAAPFALFVEDKLAAMAPALAQGITVVAGLDGGLARSYDLGALTLEPGALLAALWLAGFAWQLGRLTLQLRGLRAVVAAATEWKCLHGVRLLIGERITAPFSTRALGTRLVVLPMTLLDSPANLRLAVKHELQHLRNGDLEWIILLELLKALCFWNPAAWLWRNEFDCLQEFACDEALIGRHRVAPLAYGACLLEVASANTDAPLLAASNMTPRFALFGNSDSQLKRRILMLVNVRNTRHHVLKSLCYGILAVAGMAPAALVVFAADTAAPTADVIPVTRVNPKYPADALATKTQGQVVLEFNIDAAGNVADPTVVESCTWQEPATDADCQPNDTFSANALAALSEWKYEPGQQREGVRTILRFKLTP